MIAVVLGLAAGVGHVLLGPDHLAALTPLVLDAPRQALRAGLRWGLGHCLGVGLVGALAFLLREALPLELLSGWAERLVGLCLVGLGLWGLQRARAARTGPAPTRHVHAALAFGGLHGLAGSAHLLGALPALALPTRAATLTYLAAFCAGSLLSMLAVAAALARLGGGRARRSWQAWGSAASLIVGCLWLLSTISTPG